MLNACGSKFLGYVDGSDCDTGNADVIVCDGFIGNVGLKVSEGVVDIMQHILQESLAATITRKIGYVLSKAAYRDFKKRVDYSASGGAPLLPVQVVDIVCPIRPNPHAIMNALPPSTSSSPGLRTPPF